MTNTRMPFLFLQNVLVMLSAAEASLRFTATTTLACALLSSSVI